MRHAVVPFALAGIVAAAIVRPAHAEAPRLVDVRSASACAAPARELDERLVRVLGDGRRAKLEASVEIEASPSGYRVTIETRDETNGWGTKLVTAPSCDEAVDAAVAILALAFGARFEETSESEPERAVESTRAAPSPRASDARLDASLPSPARIDRGARVETVGAGAAERTTRVGFTTGVDVGTISDPTLTLGAAVSRSLSAVDLVAVARYGLPVVNETIETDFTESRRSDFVAAELRACAGTGESFHVAGCAGAEGGAVRVQKRRDGGDGTDRDEDSVTPRLSGTLSARLSRRGGSVEPELELGGVAVALGRDAGAPVFGLRVAAGAAIAF